MQRGDYERGKAPPPPDPTGHHVDRFHLVVPTDEDSSPEGIARIQCEEIRKLLKHSGQKRPSAKEIGEILYLPEETVRRRLNELASQRRRLARKSTNGGASSKKEDTN